MAVDTTACELNAETASRLVARFYEVKKGRKPEMVEGTSWMVRWKAVGKAVSTRCRPWGVLEYTRITRPIQNSHRCSIQPYSWIERGCQLQGQLSAALALMVRPSKLHFPYQTPSLWVRGAAQKFPDSSRCRVTARYVSGASKRKRRNASKRRRAENQFAKRVLQLGQF